MKQKSSKDKRKIPNVLKEKTSDRVYPKTLFIAAATAITLAIISAKLAGVVNSLVLVGMASILTAFISEFYRITVEGTSKIINKAITKSINERLEEEGLELTVAHDPPHEIAEEEEVNEVIKEKSLFWLFFHRLFTSRWAVTIVFAFFAITTVGTSYAIGQLNDKTDYSIVSITETQELSEKDKEALKQEAINEADKNTEEAMNETSETINLTRTELLQQISGLENFIEILEESSETDKALIENLQRQIEEQRILLDALNDRITVLENETSQQELPVE